MAGLSRELVRAKLAEAEATRKLRACARWEDSWHVRLYLGANVTCYYGLHLGMSRSTTPGPKLVCIGTE